MALRLLTFDTDYSLFLPIWTSSKNKWSYQFWSVVASTDGTFIFESCNGYPSSMVVDSAWKTARAFSVLTFIFALIVFITSVISACVTDSKLYTKAWLAPAYMLTCICQGLTLLVLESSLCNDNMLVKRMGIVSSPVSGIVFPDTCEISTGAQLCISATGKCFMDGICVKIFLPCVSLNTVWLVHCKTRSILVWSWRG